MRFLYTDYTLDTW